MKLQNELKYVNERFSLLKRESVVKHIEAVKASKNFKNIETRIAWDMGHAVIPCGTICEWYDQYNCNDDHITTLFKSAMKEYFKKEGITL